MNILAPVWTQANDRMIAEQYALTTIRRAAICDEPEPCGCGCSAWDDDWLDLVLREECGELGAAG